MPRRASKAAPRRASGPTQSPAARKAAGRTRVELWLSTEVVERLDAYRGERSRREAIEAALRLVMKVAS